MKNAFFLLFALLLPSICEAVSYSIRAEYSVGMGIPVPNEEGEFEEIIYTRQDISSKEKCENTITGDVFQTVALAYAANRSASDVVLKCVAHYWENKNCDSMYPGCVGSGDVGQPIHLHLLHEESMVPVYLRASKREYTVLQSIAFTNDEKGDHEMAFIVQHPYDKETFRTIVGESLDCHRTIKTNKFKTMFRELYFDDPRTKGFRFNCLKISADGKVEKLGDSVLKR